MILSAYYHGRRAWTAEGPTWPPGLDLEPAGEWRYVLAWSDWRKPIGESDDSGELANWRAPFGSGTELANRRGVTTSN